MIEVAVPLRIMSFNVRSAESADEGVYHWDRRSYPCVKMIREIKPDIIGFQETVESQIEYLSTSLTSYALYRIPKGLKQFANSIFYNPKKFELMEGGYRWFSLDTPTEPSPTYPDICNDGAYRTFMWVKLKEKRTGRTVWLFNTHLPWNPDKSKPNDAARKRCIEAIVRQAKRICAPEDAVFVVGDLNTAFSTAAGTLSLTALSEWMTSSYEGVGPENRDNYRSMNSFSNSAPYTNGRASIDHIFYRNVEPQRYRTIVSKSYGVTFLSDHYAICFDCCFAVQVPAGEGVKSNMEGYAGLGDIDWK
jgi:endonuclease/exonuclease/phosphatase family metal-dependent hydrolase